MNRNSGDSRYLVLTTGGTVSGNITMSSAEVLGLPATPSATGASSKEYVNNTFLKLSGGTLTGEVFGIPSIPTANDAIASKLYVDNAVTGGTVLASSVQFTPYASISATNVQIAIQTLEDRKLSLSGGLLDANANITLQGTGEVFGLPAVPTTNGSATSKLYITNLLTSYVPLSGATMNLNASITFNGGQVTGLPAVPAATGASSKEYVDSKVSAPHVVGQTIQVSPGYVATNPGTVPSYIVGNNNLWIFVNGIKQIRTYAYDEVGTSGTASTSITWQTTVTAGTIIEYLVL